MDLKTINTPILGTVLFINAAFALAVIEHGSLASAWSSLVALQADFVAPTVACVLSGVIALQMTSIAKARIVFLRWNHPLPGSQAFGPHLESDPRIDIAMLRQRIGEFPNDPIEQNRLWYALFRRVETEPSVAQAHRAYLLYRDWTVLALFTLIGVGSYVAVTSDSASGWFYIAIMLAQVLMTRNAASISGKRLVTSTLAVCASEDCHA